MRSVATPLKYLFDSYPRELSIPSRIGIARSWSELIRFVNSHNGRTNCFLTMFSYGRLKTPTRPEYASARIEFVPMDFDGLDPGIAESFKLHEWLLDHNVEHACSMSGGGVHVFIRTTGASVRIPAAALNGAQTTLEKRALGGAAPSLHIAPGQESFFGDVARCIRVPNTFNLKRRRWDEPLTATSFSALAESGPSALAQGAVELAPEEFVQPGAPLDIAEWDAEQYLPDRARWAAEQKLPREPGLGSGLEDTGVPVVVRNALLERLVGPNMNNDDRGRVIIHLYEQGYSLGEVLRFLRETLNPQKFHHAVYYERQPQRMYERYCR
jgi:hypothetical protein